MAINKSSLVPSAAMADISAGEWLNNDRVSTVFINIYAIEEHPENRSVDEEHVSDLMASIKQDGLVQPIAVRKLREEWYQHIAGWHRTLAYRRLYEETGDPKWLTIPAIVIKDCDDETAERLVWATNLITKTLSGEEAAKGFALLCENVSEYRDLHPEWKGMKTAAIVAEMTQTSPRTVMRQKARYKEKQEGPVEELAGTADAEGQYQEAGDSDDGDLALQVEYNAAINEAVAAVEKLAGFDSSKFKTTEWSRKKLKRAKRLLNEVIKNMKEDAR